ncbi:tRNA uridine-5-carboxymethylaminomethyl(34) synthesis enzyme MnmG [Helicobacter sp. MIT 99-5507]|uniref:tRNA uridine-5-carboxymethylaminomethyl(34) synthesis enzyme MnmG n=1 Tax=Helicobacter sp. MIT 99-5507 TaxID=152489 RepID=UPI000E1FA82B|nr:tRNA uridine-5-carboxymethylaminomethyl(34) synthesis enzyme MnmG [Helicobacter sp. MIT 99-5507]RDU58270.1 tRNA uridine-5-carboxymethylaminomethyl(34) synthesis enzyme MnmG [Helicobacter sp. MIT 99-5507]
MENIDVLVVGGGHAGIEASYAAAKMGLRVHLLTILVENIGLASCNPAIGGLAKGHLVKEIDALGGLMGIITDNCGIQYRILNASKGYAVRGSRAQIDMDSYRIYARNALFKIENLSISQELVEELLIESNQIYGIKTNIGKIYKAKKVILTTGTFLNGVVHIGKSISKNGRIGESSAIKLGENLSKLGFEVGRLKTGTCPRIDGKSIDFSNLEIHNGDFPPPNFSFRTSKDSFNPTQYPCYITYTNKQTHKIISDNFHLAPLFSGQISGIGPRYCPSIEDKVYRFSSKDRHQLFLEPQTKECSEYYVNGLSTSLPFDIQEKVIHSISGLENARITRYGYAIEYDYVMPTELKHTLETKKIANLYFAGQINGTTGYEEAAAQGIMAGINAALSIKGESEFILKRSEGYIGVMIDDLVTKGTDEPYRVFTSRAEYRLLLREDNATFRLSKYGYKFGLLDDISSILKDESNIKNGILFLENKNYTPTKEFLKFLDSIDEIKINDITNGIQLVARDSFDIEKLKKLDSMFCDMSDIALEQIKIECKYYHYIKKQSAEISKLDSTLDIKIPANFIFDDIPGLSLEVVEKLNKFRPNSLREASLISGITPASIDVLHLYIYLRSQGK